MKAKSIMALFAVGIVSLLGFGAPVLAEGNHYQRRHAASQQNREIRREIRSDRAELRRDYAELRRDRRDLAQLRRSGASRRDIVRKQHEINDGFREIGQGRREIRQGYGQLRANRSGFAYGRRNDRPFGNHYGWSRNDNRARGWDDRRWASRDRWDWRHD